jgi:hypothetical protein
MHHLPITREQLLQELKQSSTSVVRTYHSMINNVSTSSELLLYQQISAYLSLLKNCKIESNFLQ